MNKVFRIILAMIALAAAIFSIVMTVMAARFMEYGRFVFYLTIAISCFALAFVMVMKLKDTGD